MRVTSKQILRTYVTLTLLSTFASSFIWGINTLFLLDAGLSIAQAFASNAFFTAGQVIFEVPTGVVADTVGRRASYLLGSATLFGSTLLYLYLWQIHGPFAWWAIASMLLGLGFTFFSGATEAWLVDGLKATDYKKSLDRAFAKGQVAGGFAMLTGTIGGGVIAQFTNLGVPYILRSAVLALTFIVAFILMHDVGFKPRKSQKITLAMRKIIKASLDQGLRKPSVRWIMLTGPFVSGVLFYAFYAMQPYLLELYGNQSSYAIAGLAAAIIASTQIIGGLSVPLVGKVFAKRTSFLFFNIVFGSVVLAAIGLTSNFWLALVLLAIWGALFAASLPVRSAYLNGLIPSAQRATVLSSDSLLGSAGAVIIQPTLGKAADVWGYATSYLVGATLELLALPFVLLAKRTKASSDPFTVKVSGESTADQPEA
jgi:MFS family permease